MKSTPCVTCMLVCSILGCHHSTDPELGVPLAGEIASCRWAEIYVRSQSDTFAALHLRLDPVLELRDRDFTDVLAIPTRATLAVVRGSNLLQEFPLVMECDNFSQGEIQPDEWWEATSGSIDITAVFDTVTSNPCGGDSHEFLARLALRDVFFFGPAGGARMEDLEMPELRIGNDTCEG